MSGPAFRRCEDCGAALFPVRDPCAVCGSRLLRDEHSAGRGVVYSTTTVMRREGAHDVSLVDLDDARHARDAVTRPPALAARVRLAATVARATITGAG